MPYTLAAPAIQALHAFHFTSAAQPGHSLTTSYGRPHTGALHGPTGPDAVPGLILPSVQAAQRLGPVVPHLPPRRELAHPGHTNAVGARNVVCS